MNLHGLGIGSVRPATIILGAGASRGASFVRHRQGGPLPPLDRDFSSEQLARLPNRSATYRRFVQVATREFGPLTSRSMENVFSQLIASNEVVQLPPRKPGRPLQTFERTADDFHEVLVELFARAIGDQLCEYHDALMRRLQPGDSVIDFNYDCLADSSLTRVAAPTGMFDPRGSYGYPVAAGTQYWGGPVKRRRANPVLLLKPHGSLNWRITKDSSGTTTLALRELAYVGSAKGRIIPPIASKDIHRDPFTTVWAGCRDALASTRALLIVGYSAPEADALAQALIRLHLGARVPRGLAALVLVNPSTQVRERFRALCGTSLRPEATRVHEYDTLEAMAGAI